MSVDWSSGATQVMVVSADPDFADEWLREEAFKVWHANRIALIRMRRQQDSPVGANVIAREIRHDELVELMDGYAV
jgi:hypothetical protein